jgi:hypothetical protein
MRRLCAIQGISLRFDHLLRLWIYFDGSGKIIFCANDIAHLAPGVTAVHVWLK